MNREIRDKWVAALRSGEYKQGDSYLFDGESKYCCLGVLCRIQGVEFDEEVFLSNLKDDPLFEDDAPLMTDTVPQVYAAGLSVLQQQELAARNDGSTLLTPDGTVTFDKHNFDQIADFIESSIPVE